MEERTAFTIDEHCRRNGYSKSMYFKEKAAGRGPREMRVGNRVLISVEADTEWRRAREKQAGVA